MKIDLHCHTKKVKKGDAATRNVTAELFRDKIELADVKIVAITNHNAFDLEQYRVLKEKVLDICQVWPGVEIDVGGETRFHLIVVVKPEEEIIFSAAVDKLFEGEDLNKCLHSLEEICAAFQEFEALFIPHFHDKKPAISVSDKEKLARLVGDPSRVFIEPRNHRTLGVLANQEMNVLIGSDVQDWNHYEECTFADLRLPVGSFSEFLLLARRDTSVVETLMSKKTPLEVTGSPHSSVRLRLRLYPDVNILFGQKGTGKTEILKSLYKEMQSSGKTCRKYIASENTEDFNAFTQIGDMEADLSKVGAEMCTEEFAYISEWTDTNPTEFGRYLQWADTRGYSNNKKRMKITEAVHDVFVKDEKYDVHKSDKAKTDEVVRNLRSIELTEYFQEEELSEFRKLIGTLYDAVLSKRADDLISEYTSSLTNYSIDKIKSIADLKSDTVSRPSTTGLVDFAKRRIKLFDVVGKILNNLSVSEYNEQVRLGSLEDKGEIFINYKYRMLCPEEKTEHFPGYGIRALRETKTKLEYIKHHIFDDDLATYVEEFNNLCKENSISSTKPFLARSKQIITADGKEYAPSNGEKAILLLGHILQEDADAYFLDEPELGMGNSYIDSDIRPLITELAQRRKYVVIATHNANIAVRTLPYMSIFRTHENGEYKTYIGNPFDDRLVNIENQTDVKSWTEESMHSLEGGSEAFYERRDIYESRDN